MKNFRLTVAVAVSLLLAGVASVQAQTKVGSVDMKKLFNDYYKTGLAEKLLDKDKADARKNLKDMAQGIDKATSDYKELLDQVNDPAISSEEHDKRQQAADAKAKEIANQKAAFQQFRRQVETTLADKSQRMSGNIIAEIQKVVASQAKASGYAIVINSSNPEAVVYASPDNDITTTVLSQLNVDAPAGTTTSPAASSLPFNVSTNSLH